MLGKPRKIAETAVEPGLGHRIINDISLQGLSERDVSFAHDPRECMTSTSMLAGYLKNLSPEELRPALGQFLPKGSSTAERVALVDAALRSPEGTALRAE